MDRRYRERSPDHGYSAPRDIDSYVPGGGRPRPRSPPKYRPRSRSPARAPIDSYRGPSRRYEDPSDSYPPRARSPRRDHYDDRGPPPRERSPPPLKRGRELSPGRGSRATPPVNRERAPSPARGYGRPRRYKYTPPAELIASPSLPHLLQMTLANVSSHSPPPRASYHPRSRSPRRDDRADPYAAPSFRRRTPEGQSRGGSAVSSRRSSPRPHPRTSEAYPPEEYRSASAAYRSPRPRSPPRREAPPSRAYREDDPYTSSSRAPREHEYPPNGEAYSSREAPAPIDYRDRPTPTGPSASYREPQMSPPTGPSSAPVSMSAHNRPGSAYQAPARGGYPPYRGRGGPPPPARDYPPRDFSGPPPPRRGSSYGGPPPSYGRGGSSREYSSSYDARGPPHRESSGGFSRGGGGGSSTSLTTPRTQRFNTHLADLPKVKEGGERLPSPYETTKADKLEEEALKLRKMIDDKEMKKRQGLREWENLERESSTAALRSELAEEHLRTLNGEDSVSAAAF